MSAVRDALLACSDEQLELIVRTYIGNEVFRLVGEKLETALSELPKLKASQLAQAINAGPMIEKAERFVADS